MPVDLFAAQEIKSVPVDLFAGFAGQRSSVDLFAEPVDSSYGEIAQKEDQKAKRIAEIKAIPIDEPSIYGDLIPKIQDVPGIVAKAGAGLVKGATLGAIDPERGTVGIPFTSKRYQYAPTLSESLKEIGVSKGIADNPYIGLAPELFATIAPWSIVFKTVTALSAGAKIAKSRNVARTLGTISKGIAKRTAIQATTGAIVSGARVREEDEPLLENMLTGAAYAGAINLFAETVNLALTARKITAFNKFKDDLAELLYKEGKAVSPEQAQELSAKVITNEIAKRGGWKNISTGMAKKSSKFIKEFIKKPIKTAPKPVDISGVPAKVTQPIAGVEPSVPQIPTAVKPTIPESTAGALTQSPPEPIDLFAGEKSAISLKTIVPGVESIEKAKVATEKNIGKMSKLFTRFKELDAPTRQTFINLTEGDSQVREMSVKASVDIFKGMDEQTLDNLYSHLQEPAKHPMPEGAEKAAQTARDITKWSFLEINKLGLTSKKDIAALDKAVNEGLPIPESLKPKLALQKWPDNEILKLEDQRNKLEFKVSNAEGTESETELNSQIEQISDRIKKLENVEYFHQITSPESKGLKGRIAGRRQGKALSKGAVLKSMRGRTFTTRQEAKEAGRTVGSLPAAMADVIYTTNRTLQMDEFIKYINRNPEFSVRSDKAPNDWIKVNEGSFPSGKHMKYHPSIAEALEEITQASNKDALTAAYDKFNATAKIVGFYNPLMMGRYNVSQGYRAAGLKWFTNLPGAIKIWKEKGDTYNYLRRNGLFNNVFDLKPAITDITDNMLAEINKSKTLSSDFKKAAKTALNPIKLGHSTWKMLNEGTWKIDEIQRIATYMALKDNPRLKRHYSDFEIIELANDFMANYGKVPKQTRQALNRVVFTPTYKISMARITGRMHREAKALWPSLLRHYAMKVAFTTFIPAALTAYLKWKGTEKRAEVEGYRIIIKEPGKNKETVYSISDPVLEGKKILNRPYYRTIEYNLAAMPSALLTLLRGSLFKSKDPDWKEKINSYFKVGLPVIKELSDWEKEDKDTYQKFMQSIGLAYIYQRNPQKVPKEHAAKELLKAMDLWGDWKKMLGMKKEKRSFHRKQQRRSKR